MLSCGGGGFFIDGFENSSRAWKFFFLVRPIGKTSIKWFSSPCDAEDFILVAAKEQSQSLYHLISLAYM